MAEQSVFSIQHSLKKDYGLDVVALTPLELGAGENTWVFKAQAKDKTCYFVKLNGGAPNIGVVKLLWEAGIPQVIPPIKTLQGQYAQKMEGFTLMVYPFIEGEDGFYRELTEDQWVVLGKTLRKVHDLEVPSSLQIRREEYSPKWREAVRALLNQEIAGKIGKEIRKRKEVIHRLVDRAEELSQKLKHQPLKFVLCHSDIHGGNVLIDKNFYIVDWDDPIIAPKERDLMFIGGGVGNVWNKPHEEALFYQGYGDVAVNEDAIEYYRNERIVEDVALFSKETSQKRYEQFSSMFQKGGVVDIALNV